MLFSDEIKIFLREIANSMNSDAIAKVKASKYSALDSLHCDLGGYLKSNFLEKGKPLYLYFKNMGFEDMDEMVSALICCLYFYIKRGGI